MWVAIDVETTGLDPNIHGIIEVGMVLTDNQFNFIDNFQATFKPKPDRVIDPKAMEINGIDLNASYILGEQQAYDQYILWWAKHGKCGLIGHNVERFDLPFLKQFDPLIMERLDRDVLDTKVIANFLKIPNRSLSACYQLIPGAPRIDAHRALNDCLRTIAVLKFFREKCGF